MAMAKNKKKTSSLKAIKPSASTSSTATAGRQNPKVERAANVAKTIATFAIPMAGGAKVGAVAGKALARAVSKEATPKVLKAANKARGSGKMVNPKAATGKKTSTAPKRDVVVKTDDKVIPVKRMGYINKRGEKSIKVNTQNPTVRVVEKEVTRKQANRATSSSNRLRYGGAKKEAKRMREAVGESKILKRGGAAAGVTAGTTPGAAKVFNKDKNKKRR
jgi:nitrogen fixation/metabolism regulation signal transduction histidine kinase